MTAFSMADFRAQAAPAQCRRCDTAILIVSTDSTRRYRCKRELVMCDACPSFSPLPDGREVEPANLKGV